MSVALQDIKLQTIDFEWINNTTKLSHLKRAISLIEQDGNYFQQLKDACYARIEQIDPTSKRIKINQGVTPELQENIDNLLQEWQADVSKKKAKENNSKNEKNLQDYEKYFDNESNTMNEQKRKERAEALRTKGNQAIKSKDFDQAITYYTKSIDFDPNMVQSYGNRALAYLKKKGHQKCLEDCQKAINIDKSYSKAWHRKAKCLIGLKRRVQAYKCYKEILKLEPENNEVNKEMMELREEMNEAEIKQLESHLIPKTQFKKITIEEDSDQQEEIEEK